MHCFSSLGYRASVSPDGCRESEKSMMALRHKEYDVRGVQFHPESVLTEFGSLMIKNWVEEEV